MNRNMKYVAFPSHEWRCLYSNFRFQCKRNEKRAGGATPKETINLFQIFRENTPQTDVIVESAVADGHSR